MKKPSAFAARLRFLRARSTFTQAELAARCVPAMTPNAVAMMERGERAPTWDTVQRLAAALGVSTEEFREIEKH